MGGVGMDWNYIHMALLSRTHNVVYFRFLNTSIAWGFGITNPFLPRVCFQSKKPVVSPIQRRRALSD